MQQFDGILGQGHVLKLTLLDLAAEDVITETKNMVCVKNRQKKNRMPKMRIQHKRRLK